LSSATSRDPFARFGAFVFRRRWWVLGIWLVVLVVCAPLAGKANGVLKAGGIEVSGSGSKTASTILSKQFKVSALNNAAIVFHSDSLKVGNPEFKSQVKAAAARVRKAKGVTNVVTYYKTLLPTLVSKDRHTTVVFASMKGDEGTTQTYIKGVRNALTGVTIAHYVTGEAAVNHDFSVTSDKDLRRAEVITFTLVLLLLLITFGTVVSAFLPLVLAGAAVVGGTALIYLIGRATDTSVFALNVASMIGLGLAIDFSLIVVSRFREELAKAGDAGSALEVTMATAGRSILYSGVTVMLGMVVLSVLVDLMVIRSISIGVLVVAATALLAGLTLLPAVLGLLGQRVERLRVLPKRPPKPETEGFWYRWTHAIMRRPWAWLCASLALIIVLALPALGLKMLGSTAKLLPQSAESVQGLNYINKQFGNNALSPIQIVLKTQNGGVFTPKFLTGLDKLSNALAADRRSTGVTSLATYMAAEPRDDCLVYTTDAADD
jgi:RND superfamily putative drug exporter